MAQRVSRRIKSALPPTWINRYRRLNRFRWLAKYRALHEFGVRVREHPRLAARFILLDPELDNFTYELDNAAELVPHVAESLGADPIRTAAYLWEGHADQVLRDEIQRQTRRRLDVKRIPVFGRRLAWYAIARVLKPKLIVETGVQDGLASVLLLRAIERNAEEGHPGRLMSFDTLPGGYLVSDRFRGNWEMVLGTTHETLDPALEGTEVDMIVHDSAQEVEQFEFETVLRHAAPRVALVTNRAGTGTLEALSSQLGVAYHVFEERTRHFYPGNAMGIAVVERERIARDRLGA